MKQDILYYFTLPLVVMLISATIKKASYKLLVDAYEISTQSINQSINLSSIIFTCKTTLFSSHLFIISLWEYWSLIDDAVVLNKISVPQNNTKHNKTLVVVTQLWLLYTYRKIINPPP